MTVASLIWKCNNLFGDEEVVYDADDLSPDHKLLILHGGEDISPSLYGEKPCEKTHASTKPSQRDLVEKAAVERAWDLGIPVLGICRGAQLVCALQGGKLYQHVEFHNQDHQLVFPHLPELDTVTNSFHHQMMIPKDGELVAHAGRFKSSRWRNGILQLDDIEEPEIVYWKDTRTLGVQGHPEWDRSTKGIYFVTKFLLNKYFGV